MYRERKINPPCDMIKHVGKVMNDPSNRHEWNILSIVNNVVI